MNSRAQTPTRDPILEGDVVIHKYDKKMVRNENSDSLRLNNSYTSQLHFHTATTKDVPSKREQVLKKKFNSNVLYKQEAKKENSSVVDQILNDNKAWKNDNMEIFPNVKKKYQASWAKP